MQNPYAAATTAAPSTAASAPVETDILKAKTTGEFLGNVVLILLISGIAALVSGVVAGLLPALVIGLIAWLADWTSFWNGMGLTLAFFCGLMFIGLVWGASKPATLPSMMPASAPKPD